MSDDVEDPAAASLRHWRRRAFACADRAGLDRDERIEFAAMLTGADLLTWDQLDEPQLRRVVDGLEGFYYVVTLIGQRPPSSPAVEA